MNGVLNNAMTNTAQSAGLGTDKTRTRERPEHLETTVRRPQEEQPTPGRPQPTPGQPDGAPVRRRTVVRKRIRRQPNSSSWTSTETKATKGETAKNSGKAGGSNLVWQAMGSRASLHRASLGFEQNQAQSSPTNQPNQRSQQQFMLNRLVRMVSISMEQHTGGRSGESYSRRDTRRILGALSSLTTSSKPKSSEKTDRDRGRFTDAALEAKRSRVLGLLAILEPEPLPEGYEPTQMVA